MKGDEQYECKQCHELYELGDGLEPTDYCNTCAQELVATLRARLQEAEWIIEKVYEFPTGSERFLEWMTRRDAWLKGVKSNE